MKKLFALAVLAALAFPAVAGDDGGFTCTNACPLAQQANVRRATGSEAVAASAVVRADVAAAVARNLERI